MEIRERKQNRLTQYDYSREGCYFVTMCTQSRARLFEIEDAVGNGLCAVQINVGHKKVERHTDRSLHFYSSVVSS